MTGSIINVKNNGGNIRQRWSSSSSLFTGTTAFNSDIGIGTKRQEKETSGTTISSTSTQDLLDLGDGTATATHDDTKQDEGFLSANQKDNGNARYIQKTDDEHRPTTAAYHNTTTNNQNRRSSSCNNDYFNDDYDDDFDEDVTYTQCVSDPMPSLGKALCAKRNSLTTILFIAYSLSVASVSVPVTLVPMMASEVVGMNSYGIYYTEASFASKMTSYAVMGTSLGKFLNGGMGDVFGARRVLVVYSFLGSLSLLMLSVSRTPTHLLWSSAMIEFWFAVQWPCLTIMLASHYCGSGDQQRGTSSSTSTTTSINNDDSKYERGINIISLASRFGAMISIPYCSHMLSVHEVSWRILARGGSFLSLLSCACYYFWSRDSPTKLHDPNNPPTILPPPAGTDDTSTTTNKHSSTSRTLSSSPFGSTGNRMFHPVLSGRHLQHEPTLISTLIGTLVHIIQTTVRPSLVAVLGSGTFWIVSLAHVGGSVIRSSERVIGTYFENTSADSSINKFQSGGYSVIMACGIMVGLLRWGNQFSSSSVSSRHSRIQMVRRLYGKAVLMCGLLSLTAMPIMKRLVPSLILWWIQVVSCFWLTACLAVQFYHIPAMVSNMYGKNRGIYLSYTDGVSYGISSFLFQIFGRIISQSPNYGWTYCWMDVALVVFATGTIMVHFMTMFLSSSSSTTTTTGSTSTTTSPTMGADGKGGGIMDDRHHRYYDHRKDLLDQRVVEQFQHSLPHAVHDVFATAAATRPTFIGSGSSARSQHKGHFYVHPPRDNDSSAVNSSTLMSRQMRRGRNPPRNSNPYGRESDYNNSHTNDGLKDDDDLMLFSESEGETTEDDDDLMNPLDDNDDDDDNRGRNNKHRLFDYNLKHVMSFKHNLRRRPSPASNNNRRQLHPQMGLVDPTLNTVSPVLGHHHHHRTNSNSSGESSTTSSRGNKEQPINAVSAGIPTTSSSSQVHLNSSFVEMTSTSSLNATEQTSTTGKMSQSSSNGGTASTTGPLLDHFYTSLAAEQQRQRRTNSGMLNLEDDQTKTKSTDTSSITMKDRLVELMEHQPDNQICVDCEAPLPRWITISHIPVPLLLQSGSTSAAQTTMVGAFCCTECAGQHRKLGVHIVFVRSVDHDALTKDEMLSVGRGNLYWNAMYEAQLPLDMKSNKHLMRMDNSMRERFINDKYRRRLWFDETKVLLHDVGHTSTGTINNNNNHNATTSSNRYNNHNATTSSNRYVFDMSSVLPSVEDQRAALEEINFFSDATGNNSNADLLAIGLQQPSAVSTNTAASSSLGYDTTTRTSLSSKHKNTSTSSTNMRTKEETSHHYHYGYDHMDEIDDGMDTDDSSSKLVTVYNSDSSDDDVDNNNDDDDDIERATAIKQRNKKTTNENVMRSANETASAAAAAPAQTGLSFFTSMLNKNQSHDQTTTTSARNITKQAAKERRKPSASSHSRGNMVGVPPHPGRTKGTSRHEDV